MAYDEKLKAFLTTPSSRLGYANYTQVKREVQRNRNKLLSSIEFYGTVIGLPRATQAEVSAPPPDNAPANNGFASVFRIRIDQLDTKVLPNPTRKMNATSTMNVVRMHGDAYLPPGMPSVSLGQRVKVLFDSSPLLNPGAIPTVVEVLSVDEFFAERMLENLSDSTEGELYGAFFDGNFKPISDTDDEFPPYIVPYLDPEAEFPVEAGNIHVTHPNLLQDGIGIQGVLTYRGSAGNFKLIKNPTPLPADTINYEGPGGTTLQLQLATTWVGRLLNLAQAYTIFCSDKTFTTGTNSLYLTSVYRPYATQLRLYKTAQANKQALLAEAETLTGQAKQDKIKAANKAGRIAAKPNGGPHMMGCAFDFSYFATGGKGYPDPNDIRTKWMKDNAPAFGFKKTVSYESWHFEIHQGNWKNSVWNWNDKTLKGQT